MYRTEANIDCPEKMHPSFSSKINATTYLHRNDGHDVLVRLGESWSICQKSQLF
jgi:hypothetical protein